MQVREIVVVIDNRNIKGFVFEFNFARVQCVLSPIERLSASFQAGFAQRLGCFDFPQQKMTAAQKVQIRFESKAI
jgi:hypothetical protein